MSFVQSGDCEEERESRGTLGPVKDSEVLIRIVRSPQHINKKTGVLRPGLFPFSDLGRKGLSLTRDGHFSREDFMNYASVVAEMKPGETLHGFRSTEAGSIRSLKNEEGNRSLCVVEDPEKEITNIPDNIAHAVAFSSVPLDQDTAKDRLIEIQTELTKLFREHSI